MQNNEKCSTKTAEQLEKTDLLRYDECPEITFREYHFGAEEARAIIQDLIAAARGRNVEATVSGSTRTFLYFWTMGDGDFWRSDFARYIWENVCDGYDTERRKAYRVCGSVKKGGYKSFTVSEEAFGHFLEQDREYTVTVNLEDTCFYPLCDVIDNLVRNKDTIKAEAEYIVKIPESAVIERREDYDEIWAERKAEIEENPEYARYFPDWVHELKKIYPGWGRNLLETMRM